MDRTQVRRQLRTEWLRDINAAVNIAWKGGAVSSPSAGGGALAVHPLSGAFHTGFLADGQAPQFLLINGSRNLIGNLGVNDGITIDGMDPSVHQADPNAHHPRVALGTNPGLLFADQNNQSGLVVGLDTNPGLQRLAGGLSVDLDTNPGLQRLAGGLSVLLGTPSYLTRTGGLAVVTTTDGDATPDTVLRTDANGFLEVRSFRTDSISADADLTLDPLGNILLPNAQEARTVAFSDLVTGIAGMRLWDRGGNYRQMTIGAMKIDELYARVFVADEVRIDRGEEYWSKSYGVVETDFTIPARDTATPPTTTRDVWFEDAPALATANLFTVGDYLLLRMIDWSAGLVISKCWFEVIAKVAAGVSADNTSRQQWRLARRSVSGVLGATVKKGTTLLDVGQSGQGWIHLSALEQDGGPFIQLGDWAGTDPISPSNFTNRVRLGNLNGVAGYAVDTWGLAAGVDLSVAAGSGFTGVTLDPANGVRLWNTSIATYNGGVRTGYWAPAGYFYLGSNVDAGASTADFAFYSNTGNLVMGNQAAANMLWNRSAGQLQFRNATTVHAYVDTDGTVRAGSGAVKLSELGIALRMINPTETIQQALTMESNAGAVLGGLYTSVDNVATPTVQVTHLRNGADTVDGIIYVSAGSGAANRLGTLYLRALGAGGNSVIQLNAANLTSNATSYWTGYNITLDAANALQLDGGSSQALLTSTGITLTGRLSVPDGLVNGSSVIDDINGGSVDFSVRNGYSIAGSLDEMASLKFQFENSTGTVVDAALVRAGKEEDFSTTALRSAFLSFWTIADNGLAERMRLTAAGALGLGVTVPASKFHLNGAMTFEGMATAPATLPAGDEMKVYCRGNQFVIMFNDAGVVRYKSLDLTGTGVTWVHSTTPP